MEAGIEFGTLMQFKNIVRDFSIQAEGKYIG